MLFDISYAFDKVRREKIKSNHRLYGSLFDVEHIIQQWKDFDANQNQGMFKGNPFVLQFAISLLIGFIDICS